MDRDELRSMKEDRKWHVMDRMVWKDGAIVGEEVVMRVGGRARARARASASSEHAQVSMDR